MRKMDNTFFQHHCESHVNLVRHIKIDKSKRQIQTSSGCYMLLMQPKCTEINETVSVLKSLSICEEIFLALLFLKLIPPLKMNKITAFEISSKAKKGTLPPFCSPSQVPIWLVHS